MLPKDSDESDLEQLRERLKRARWRARTASAGGPEWDAATAEIEELERDLFGAAGSEPGDDVGGDEAVRNV